MTPHKEFTRKEVLEIIRDLVHVDWRKRKLFHGGEQTEPKVPQHLADDLFEAAFEAEKNETARRLDAEFNAGFAVTEQINNGE